MEKVKNDYDNIIVGGNDNDVSEMRKRNEKRLSVQQQGRCVKFCKRSAENRDDGNCEDHSLKGKGGVFRRQKYSIGVCNAAPC